MSPVAPLPESHTAATGASASTSTNGGSASSKPHRPLAPPPIVTNGKEASGRSPPR